MTTTLPALDQLEAMLGRITAVESQPRLRDKDGEERYELVGVPCGFPVAIFGDANDAAFDLACRLHLPAFLACARALEKLSVAVATDFIAREVIEEAEKALQMLESGR